MFPKIIAVAAATCAVFSASAQGTQPAAKRSPMRNKSLSVGLNVDLPQFGMDDDRNINYRLRCFNPNAGYF